MAAESTHVIIVGGGFAGLACAHRLGSQHGIQVTLLEQRGYHQFTPLLYQVATAELPAKEARFDLTQRLHRHPNIAVRTDQVVAADPQAPQVTLAGGETLAGDVLVLAAGSQPEFFGTAGAGEFSYPLYTLPDAERIRARMQQLLRSPQQAGPLTFVVVGGGPTGVETAGALADLIDDVLAHRGASPGADPPAQVILIDHGQVLLAAFSEQSQQRAAARLRERGVLLRFGVAVKEVAADHVRLSDGATVATQLPVWAGGISAAPLVGAAGLYTGHGGRIDVSPDLTVPGFPAVYAVGDAANIPAPGAQPAHPLPQLGSVAMQSGDWAARNILAARTGGPRRPFDYHDKGILAMLDRQAAIAELGPKHHEIHGRLAFATWLAVHAELLHNAHAEVGALARWADEFYLRPHHRSAALLEV